MSQISASGKYRRAEVVQWTFPCRSRDRGNQRRSSSCEGRRPSRPRGPVPAGNSWTRGAGSAAALPRDRGRRVPLVLERRARLLPSRREAGDDRRGRGAARPILEGPPLRGGGLRPLLTGPLPVPSQVYGICLRRQGRAPDAVAVRGGLDSLGRPALVRADRGPGLPRRDRPAPRRPMRTAGGRTVRRVTGGGGGRWSK